MCSLSIFRSLLAYGGLQSNDSFAIVAARLIIVKSSTRFVVVRVSRVIKSSSGVDRALPRPRAVHVLVRSKAGEK